MLSIFGKTFSLQKEKFIKPLVLMLGVLIIALIAYLVFLPIYPVLEYQYLSWQDRSGQTAFQNSPAKDESTEKIIEQSPSTGNDIDINRIIIAKIGVDSPIIESVNSDQALNRGAWRVPESSTPLGGGNVVITGHRFKYLPPNNLTFYLLDKLKPGDIISLLWEKQEYYYRVKELKIVASDDSTILQPTDRPRLTLYTCAPIWSQEKRLVVISELVEQQL